MKREHRVSWNSGDCIQPDVELTRNANYRYLPIMITRLMISLRKAAHPQGSAWTMGESTANRGPRRETYSMQIVRGRTSSNTRDDATPASPISPGV